MITRKELLESKEYWLEKIQNELFREIDKYMSENKISRSQLAMKLGCNRSYVSQVLNGNFDHKLSKLIEFSLAIGKAPNIEFAPLQEIIDFDKNGLNYIEECKIKFIVNYKDTFKSDSISSKWHKPGKQNSTSWHSLNYQTKDSLLID